VTGGWFLIAGCDWLSEVFKGSIKVKCLVMEFGAICHSFGSIFGADMIPDPVQVGCSTGKAKGDFGVHCGFSFALR